MSNIVDAYCVYRCNQEIKRSTEASKEMLSERSYVNRKRYPNSRLTGKSLSEALLFAEHGENILCTRVVLNVRNNFFTQHFLHRFELGIFMY